MNKRICPVIVLACLSPIYLTCASIRTADTKEFVRAKSEAESAVHLIKQNFRPRDLEYVKAEELYGKLKADHDCILDAFMKAVHDGKDPNDERNFGTCAKDGQRDRADFVSFVHDVLVAPRRDPTTNQTQILADTPSTSTGLTNFVNAANQALALFDHIFDLATKYHEKHAADSDEKKTKEISRLQALSWRSFDQIP